MVTVSFESTRLLELLGIQVRTVGIGRIGSMAKIGRIASMAIWTGLAGSERLVGLGEA